MGKINLWRNGPYEPLGTLSPINIRLKDHRGEKVWLEETGNERGYVDAPFMKSDKIILPGMLRKRSVARCDGIFVCFQSW